LEFRRLAVLEGRGSALAYLEGMLDPSVVATTAPHRLSSYFRDDDDRGRRFRALLDVQHAVLSQRNRQHDSTRALIRRAFEVVETSR
jgi:hypothetical protein